MKIDILAILMVAFGLFAILLFILFYVYARNARNKKREDDEYIQEELTNDEIDKLKSIDKDSDNLVDEDIEKNDIKELHIETETVEDFKEDGSSINSKIVIEPIHEEKNNYDIEEGFVPKKKNR